MRQATQIVTQHSLRATRRHPWEPWQEPPLSETEARYFSIRVEVLAQLNELALVGYAGRRLVVEVRDLTEVTK